MSYLAVPKHLGLRPQRTNLLTFPSFSPQFCPETLFTDVTLHPPLQNCHILFNTHPSPHLPQTHTLATAGSFHFQLALSSPHFPHPHSPLPHPRPALPTTHRNLSGNVLQLILLPFLGKVPCSSFTRRTRLVRHKCLGIYVL
jgi:hypothetical protein